MPVLDLDALTPYMSIGNQGEAGVTTLQFDVADWETAYPGLTYAASLQYHNTGEVIPLSGITESAGTLTWVVGNDATLYAGQATVVVRGTLAGIDKRSAMFTVSIAEGHSSVGDAPAAIDDWITEATTLKAEIEAAETVHDEAYAGAEAARDDLYTAAEGARDVLYQSAEDDRDSLYEAAELARNSTFGEAEESRATAEEGRDTAEDLRVTAEETRAAFYAGFNDRLTALEGAEDWGMIV